MYTFIIRNNKPLISYIKSHWGYFLRKKPEDCKITVRKENVFIHISSYYCIVLNDLKFLQEKGLLKANSKAIKWLNNYK